MKMSDSIANIATALAEFQSTVNSVSKNSTNPAFRSKYASLDDIIKEIRQPMKRCGLSFVQNPYRDENAVGVSTLLVHTSGEYMFFDAVTITLADKGNAGHQVGSAMTYARRFSLSAALGLATDEDTDGNDIDPPKKSSSYTRDSSASYSANKTGSSRPLPNSWSQLAQEKIAEDIELEETSMQLKHDSNQDLNKDWRNKHIRFMIWFKERKVTCEERRSIIRRATGKTSSKQLTTDEMRSVCRAFLIENREAV